jgi:hypothetical protein
MVRSVQASWMGGFVHSKTVQRRCTRLIVHIHHHIVLLNRFVFGFWWVMLVVALTGLDVSIEVLWSAAMD